MSKRRSHAQSPRRLPLIKLIGALAVALVGLVAVALLLSGGNAAGTAPVTADPQAPGRLVTDATTVDLGRVPFTEKTEARFVLANTGGETVQLVGAPRVRMLEGC